MWKVAIFEAELSAVLIVSATESFLPVAVFGTFSVTVAKPFVGEPRFHFDTLAVRGVLARHAPWAVDGERPARGGPRRNRSRAAATDEGGQLGLD
jgi:hypothetical protein